MRTCEPGGAKSGMTWGNSEKPIELLFGILVGTIDLASAAKHAHWHVRGSHLLVVQELFERISAKLNTEVDQMVQRAAELGSAARGAVQMAASGASLEPYPMRSMTGLEHVDAMTQQLARLGAALRAGAEECKKLHDPMTADVLDKVSICIGRLLWLAESYSVRIR